MFLPHHGVIYSCRIQDKGSGQEAAGAHGHVLHSTSSLLAGFFSRLLHDAFAGSAARVHERFGAPGGSEIDFSGGDCAERRVPRERFPHSSFPSSSPIPCSKERVPTCGSVSARCRVAAEEAAAV